MALNTASFGGLTVFIVTKKGKKLIYLSTKAAANLHLNLILALLRLKQVLQVYMAELP